MHPPPRPTPTSRGLRATAKRRPESRTCSGCPESRTCSGRPESRTCSGRTPNVAPSRSAARPETPARDPNPGTPSHGETPPGVPNLFGPYPQRGARPVCCSPRDLRETVQISALPVSHCSEMSRIVHFCRVRIVTCTDMDKPGGIVYSASIPFSAPNESRARQVLFRRRRCNPPCGTSRPGIGPSWGSQGRPMPTTSWPASRMPACSRDNRHVPCAGISPGSVPPRRSCRRCYSRGAAAAGAANPPGGMGGMRTEQSSRRHAAPRYCDAGPDRGRQVVLWPVTSSRKANP